MVFFFQGAKKQLEDEGKFTSSQGCVSFCALGFGLLELKLGLRANIFFELREHVICAWVKKRVSPAWNPPAVPWWFKFDIYIYTHVDACLKLGDLFPGHLVGHSSTWLPFCLIAFPLKKLDTSNQHNSPLQEGYVADP